MVRVLIVFAAFVLLACGSDTPVPEYPFPAQTPLEETDLAQYVMDEDDLAAEEEEEWDDGLSDEDLEMDSSESTPAPEAAETAEPAEDAEASDEEGDS